MLFKKLFNILILKKKEGINPLFIKVKFNNLQYENGL